ncbi:NUDIX domain-containing protein [Tenggerimyces flavus]|uniref:NUDIX domain-containing protein n=1 Tax=Tenggerimyces flavus TaxID=1708749 RepID=A0ABV7YLN9_9ACTN|nr:NUDIX domain-containing protein [Tenggerimyces flavus]MBM7789527.1 8-oxo-dGTP pyrophosphatase MutT (NUDIX family) [Tenggerimyces flavus]
MKRLVDRQTDVALLKGGEARLYLADEAPPAEVWGTAFGFVFDGDRMLLTHLRDRGWDLPGGVIDPGETPEVAAVREVWEEAYARVEIVELIGFQELEVFFPKPADYRWSYPVATQVHYRCRLFELCPFEENEESTDRAFFPPDEARAIATEKGYLPIYEEALRRAMLG